MLAPPVAGKMHRQTRNLVEDRLKLILLTNRQFDGCQGTLAAEKLL